MVWSLPVSQPPPPPVLYRGRTNAHGGPPAGLGPGKLSDSPGQNHHTGGVVVLCHPFLTPLTGSQTHQLLLCHQAELMDLSL